MISNAYKNIINFAENLFEDILNSAIDYIFIRIYLQQFPFDNKFLGHDFKPMNSNFKSVDFLHTYESNFKCSKCNIKIRIDPSHNSKINNGWFYDYLSKSSYENLDINCNEYIIKKLVE